MMSPFFQIPGYFAAFTAGLLSFLSPCVLPLIPVYISFISGESATDLQKGNSRRFPLLLLSLFFVAGFTLIFVLLAIIFGGGMRFIGNSASLLITRIAGIIILILGINTLFDFIPFLRKEMRIHRIQKGKPTYLKALLLGMAFAAGWSPCIGPILSSLLLYAGKDGNIAHASFLLALYSTGLGLPFILVTLFFERALPVMGWFKKHLDTVRIISGILLLVFGLTMIKGSLSGLTVFFFKAGTTIEEYAQTSPLWLRPFLLFIVQWFTFQGL